MCIGLLMYNEDMKLVIAPGNSARHKEWAEKLRDYFLDTYDEVYVHYYRHWERNEPEADVEYEITALQEKVGDESVDVIAKSIGTVILSFAIHQGAIKPHISLLLGVPFKILSERNYDLPNLLSNYNTISVVQNSSDPMGSFADVREYFSDLAHIKVYEHEGDTHDYLDFQQMKDILIPHG